MTTIETAVTRTLRWFAASAAVIVFATIGSTVQAQADSADLGLTAGPVTVSAVNPSVFTTFWSVTNSGPTTASNVVAVITLPTGTSFTSAFVQAGMPACSFDVASRQVACAIGTLAAGISTSASVTFANTANPAGTQLTVTARLTSDTPDPASANNSASALLTPQGGPVPTVPAGPSANLGLSALAAPAVPPVGVSTEGFLSWNVFNAGPDQAEGVILVLAFPVGVTVIEAFIGAGDATCPFVAATREATCTLQGPLASGATINASVVFTTEGPAANTPITVVATVRATTVDPDPTDNVRPNTFGAPTGTAIPATGAPSSTIAIIAVMATFALVSGIGLLSVTRRR